MNTLIFIPIFTRWWRTPYSSERRRSPRPEFQQRRRLPRHQPDRLPPLPESPLKPLEELFRAKVIHFLDTAYGSAREVEYQVSLAFRLGLLREPAYQDLSALTVETSKVLNGLLRSLRKA